MRWVIAALLSVALAMPSVARADDKASQYFERGVEAYQEKQFKIAAEWFRKAYELDARPDYLYSWAQSERYNANCRRAIELYEEMLRMELADNQRAAVANSKEACEREVATQLPKPDPKPDPGPGDDRAASLTVPVSLWIAGGVGIGIASGLFVAAQGKEDDADAATSYGEVDDAVGAAHSRRVAGSLVLAAGILLVGSGTALFIVKRRASSKGETAVAPWLGHDSAGVSLSGSF